MKDILKFQLAATNLKSSILFLIDQNIQKYFPKPEKILKYLPEARRLKFYKKIQIDKKNFENISPCMKKLLKDLPEVGVFLPEKSRSQIDETEAHI